MGRISWVSSWLFHLPASVPQPHCSILCASSNANILGMWREKNNKNQKTQTVMWWSHHFFSTFYTISFLFLRNKTYDCTQWSQKITLLNDVMLKIFSGKQIYICIPQSEIKQCNLYQCRPTCVTLGYDSKHKKRAPVIRRPSDWNLIDKRFQYTSSSRVSLFKRCRTETSQKAIKMHWRAITKSCTNRKSVQQGLTSISQFHSSRLFRHENHTIREVNRRKMELKHMHAPCASRSSYFLEKAPMHQAGTCCFHWNPVLMRSFSQKLFIIKAYQLTRAESESLEEWGSFQLVSVNSKLLKTQAQPAGYPWTAVCLVEKATNKGKFCFLKLQTFEK